MKALDTWSKNQEDDASMEDDHYLLWMKIIKIIENENLQGKKILDFGCNQGKFLRLLHRHKPFKEAYGVDVAHKSIEIANQRKGSLPIKYEVCTNIEHHKNEIDIAFSHEVLYLVKDLKKHAEEIYNALKSGGRYYAALGCHTDNPLWPNFRNIIKKYSHIQVQDYSLNYIADIFREAGFCVFAQRFLLDEFILIKKDNPYFPSVMDALDYYREYKILFRFEKNEG